ncbi:hypothetical protein BCV72DRAFT_102182 [Rhizopus microsporus var. microsporus]|uniref:Extracellular metalloproteinase n=1 Tax=Rhizopus microsporus var. microsporus TaxID=86635 RepID=A0A1X0R6W8_RHIZD|nr:hypothetical protein BCV72DRAFT_102182 [Rhizopus microsporus var. microsporus]
MKIGLAILCLFASQGLGSILPGDSKVHYRLGLSRSFGPDLAHREYKLYDTVGNFQGTKRSELNAEEIAIEFAKRELTTSDFIVQSSYKTDLNGVTHVYLRQIVNGLEVFNGNININVDRSGQIISAGNSFAPTKSSASFFNQFIFSSPSSFFNEPKNVIPPQDAILSLVSFVKGGHPVDPNEFVQLNSFKDPDVMMFENVPYAESPVEVKQGYLQLDNGQLQLVWDIQYELQDNWYNGHVNAYDGTVISLVDWVSSASYRVIPFGINDPTESSRILLKNPQDSWASPYGWHVQGIQSQGAQPFNVTIGNNAYTHTNPDGGNNWENNYRPTGQLDSDDDITFDYEADFDTQEPVDYQDAAVTNLFYWCNVAHDFFHRYGFDEKAGNFQQSNLGRGREKDNGENDAVIANAQDGSGRNNANFATPPDGKHGKMRMYIWDQTSPMRDGDFESGIIIHEYTHGVSIRLTGGPANSNCLNWNEAGGMGEGWGDFIATVIRMKKEYTRDIDFSMGNYANGGEGIRKYKYSTSMKTNPSTYKIMDRFDYWGVHAKGEVWAEMLYEVYWNLVDLLGFTPDWFPPAPEDTFKTAMDSDDLQKVRDHITSYGNTLAVQLVIDGLKLQPCSPTFVDARDAILQAEQQLTQGKYYCDIYRAFAKRGLGVGAKVTQRGWLEQRTESFELPSACQ